jgi:hypothetical protein
VTGIAEAVGTGVIFCACYIASRAIVYAITRGRK